MKFSRAWSRRTPFTGGCQICKGNLIIIALDFALAFFFFFCQLQSCLLITFASVGQRGLALGEGSQMCSVRDVEHSVLWGRLFTVYCEGGWPPCTVREADHSLPGSGPGIHLITDWVSHRSKYTHTRHKIKLHQNTYNLWSSMIIVWVWFH